MWSVNVVVQLWWCDCGGATVVCECLLNLKRRVAEDVLYEPPVNNTLSNVKPDVQCSSACHRETSWTMFDLKPDQAILAKQTKLFLPNRQKE